MFSLVLAAALSFGESHARLAYETAGRLTAEYTPRDAGTMRGMAAANFILDAASAAGADAKLDRFHAKTPLGTRVFTNVSCEWTSNPTGEWVVVVSHYDTKRGVDCPGANDGASTTGLLVGLCAALSEWKSPRGNVMLMWLDGEECIKAYLDDDGFQGSKRAAAELKASGRKVSAVICADMLGDRDLSIGLPRNTSAELRRIALKAAEDEGLSGRVVEMDELVKDDHVAFQKLGFRAVDLIDFEYGSAPGLNDYWHTERDTMDKVSVESLRISGRLICRMIESLL